MPTAPLRPCGQPGCGALVERGRCDQHKRTQQRRQYDDHRGSSAARGYDAAWQHFREWFLRQEDNVICADCRLRLSTEVHHKKKLADYPELRLDAGNCIGLCHACHSARTARGE